MIDKRVVVIDDHDLVRQGICDLVDSIEGATVVGSASDGYSFEAIPADLYDSVICDLTLPDIPGVMLLRRLARTRPSLTLIAISGNADAHTIRIALEAGATTCLSKATPRAELRMYIQGSLMGASILDPHTRSRVLSPEHSATTATASDLSFREVQILGLLARNLTAKQVGEQLYISEATVRSHRNRIYRKLGISTRSEAAREYDRIVACSSDGESSLAAGETRTEMENPLLLKSGSPRLQVDQV